MSLFTSSDGTRLRLGKVAVTSLGVISGAVFGGYADVVSAFLTSFVVNPITGIGSFLSSVVAGILDIPTASSTAAFDTTVDFVTGFGVFSWVVAVVFTVALAYIVASRGGLSA